jgi:hypothetical protein
MPATLVLTGAVVAAGLATLHPRMRAIPRVLRGSCLVLSPAVLLVLGQMLAYPAFSVGYEPLTAPAVPARLAGSSAGPSGNVYLFIFDEWSYARTFGDDLAEQMPNLARFAERATVYHDAHAPFGATRLSLPGILFQTNEQYTWESGKPGFVRPGGRIDDVMRRSNVFSRMKTLGYRTHLAGFSHPYRFMFGPELDTCLSAPDGRGNEDAHLTGDDFLRHLRLAGSLAAMALPKPAGAEWRVHRWCMQDDLAPRIEQVAIVHRRALEIVRTVSPSFAVLHYPLPHDPFVFDREGVNLELPRTLPLDFGPYGPHGFIRPNPGNHVARYRGNLRYLDTVLGELFDAMREAGNFDDATIVLTSDHTWRFDPALDGLYIERGLPFRSLDFDPVPRALTHVPLIIRQPGQSRRIDIREPAELIDLLDMLELDTPHQRAPAPPASVAGVSPGDRRLGDRG